MLARASIEWQPVYFNVPITQIMGDNKITSKIKLDDVEFFLFCVNIKTIYTWIAFSIDIRSRPRGICLPDYLIQKIAFYCCDLSINKNIDKSIIYNYNRRNKFKPFFYDEFFCNDITSDDSLSEEYLESLENNHQSDDDWPETIDDVDDYFESD